MLIITYFPIIPFYFAFYRTTPTEKTYKRSSPPRCISILFGITLVLFSIFHLDTSFITSESSLLILLLPPKYFILTLFDLSFHIILKLVFHLHKRMCYRTALYINVLLTAHNSLSQYHFRLACKVGCPKHL